MSHIFGSAHNKNCSSPCSVVDNTSDFSPLAEIVLFYLLISKSVLLYIRSTNIVHYCALLSLNLIKKILSNLSALNVDLTQRAD